MPLFDRVWSLGKFFSGKHDQEVAAVAAQQAREEVMDRVEAVRMEAAESAAAIAYALDELGYDRVSGQGFLPQLRRNVRSVIVGLTRTRAKYSRDGYIKRGISLHTDFVFGNGVDVPKAKSEAIQDEIVSPFWNDPVNHRNFFSFRAQQRRSRETQLSGELNILVKLDPATSRVRLYPILPKEIVEVIPDPDEPGRPAFYQLRRERKEFDFQRGGFKQPETKTEIFRAYRYKIFEASDEELARGLIYHVGINEFFDDMRGESDVLTCYDESQSAQEIAQDGATLSHANAETGYKTMIKKGGKATKDAVAEYFRTRTDGSNPTPAAGSEWIEDPSATERNWMTARDTGAAHREKDQRLMRLYTFAALGFGEHYFGDASTGNLATATSMELPVIKMIQAEQKFWESVYLDLINFQIDIAAVGGRISGEVVDRDELEVETEEIRSIDIDFPPITQKEIGAYVTALGTAFDKNLLPEREAARLIMEGFGVNNIDELLDELGDEKAIREKINQIIAGKQQAKGADGKEPPEAGGDNPPAEGGEAKQMPAAESTGARRYRTLASWQK